MSSSTPHTIPKDPIILLSYLNTKLRDEYPSLSELCLSLGLKEEVLTEKLAALDFHYDAALNRFR